MKLDSKYYSFCREIGLMKENFGHQHALDAIKREVKNAAAADPAYVALVDKLTLNSPEVSVRVCVLYAYEAEVDYVVGGNIKTTTIKDFGYAGVPDSLKITNYKGNGEYTTLQDVSSVPYAIYNDGNLFTFEQMKGALTTAVEEHLPKNCTSFKSRDWSVSAYFVPVLNVTMHFGGKTYTMNYNLQNGSYHWDYPDNPELIKKGKKAHVFTNLLKMGAFLLDIIAIIMSASLNWYPGLGVGAIATIVTFFYVKKSKKAKGYWDKLFIKNPKKSMLSALMPSILIVAFTFISMIIVFVGGAK